MAKFKVGDSPRSLLEISGHHLKGGTWYTPESIGMSEKDLRTQFPFLVWDSPPTEEAKPEIIEQPKLKPKSKSKRNKR